MTDAVAALMDRHWLVFEFDADLERHVVSGCHCGFSADLGSDCGWGDSVVEHLFEIGLRA